MLQHNHSKNNRTHRQVSIFKVSSDNSSRQ